MDKCVGVWKTLCEVWKTLCVGEGVKINSKIISKKIGGVECLFYFCSVKTLARPINGLQFYWLRPWWGSINGECLDFYI